MYTTCVLSLGARRRVLPGSTSSIATRTRVPSSDGTRMFLTCPSATGILFLLSMLITFIISLLLEAKQSRQLDRNRAVDESPHQGFRGVPAVAVHDEKLAARNVFPPQAHAGAHRLIARVVLHQTADEHSRRRRENPSGGHQPILKGALRQIDPVHRHAGFDAHA